MKIAVLAFSSLPRDVGGAQIFTFNLIRHLLRRSHEVHLYVPRKYAAEAAGISARLAKGLKVIPISFLENGLVRYLPWAVSAILVARQLINRYDVWQVIGAYPAGFVARRLRGMVPVVLRSYGSDIQKDAELGYGLRLDPFLENRIKGTVPAMSHLVALTPTVRECYLELGAAEGKISEISNGIDFQRFRRQPDRARIRAGLGIAEGQVFILSTGRYHPKKGYEYIPRAARILIDKGFDIRWLIVGKDVHVLEAEIARAGVGGVVVPVEGMGMEAHGRPDAALSMPPDTLIDLYRSADIYAMPSLIETFGMVLIEAMASDLPVVTTDAPGCRDVVQSESNGLRAIPADPVSLASCIERILRDGELRTRLVAAALESARRHDWEHVVGKYEKLYSNLVKE